MTAQRRSVKILGTIELWRTRFHYRLQARFLTHTRPILVTEPPRYRAWRPMGKGYLQPPCGIRWAAPGQIRPATELSGHSADDYSSLTPSQERALPARLGSRSVAATAKPVCGKDREREMPNRPNFY